jgi:hypothetical protein
MPALGRVWLAYALRDSERWPLFGFPRRRRVQSILPSILLRQSSGRLQAFEHGQMVWSPATGQNSVQIGWSRDGRLGLDWSSTEPFTYDKFVVRYDRNGVNIGQDDLQQQTIPNDSGRWTWNTSLLGPLQPGTYRLVVEGCDNGTFGTNCKQGFSLPAFVVVR